MARFEPEIRCYFKYIVNNTDSLTIGTKTGVIRMANQNKFEEMLERLINEDKKGAEELFHEIVVEKSRSIYENLLDDEDEDETETESYKDKRKKGKDDDEDVEEDFDLDSFEIEAEDDDNPMATLGGDETDDLEMDVDADGEEDGEMDMDMDGEMDMDSEEDGDVEDRVEDLEDALDELKAEFDSMMSGEEGEEDGEMDMDGEDETDMDMDDEEDDEMDMDDEEGEDEEDDTQESYRDPTDQVGTMREYVERVNATMGDDGAQNQSTVAGPNDMGGTADNIARGDTESGVEANKGDLQGSSLSDKKPKDMSTGNVNVPGGKASKSNKNYSKGHGAEKKGSGETADNKQSTIRSRK